MLIVPRPISEIQKKTKIIEKLAELGFTTEEQIKNLRPSDLTKADNVSFYELITIYKLQESIKNNTVYSFLTAKSEVE